MIFDKVGQLITHSVMCTLSSTNSRQLGSRTRPYLIPSLPLPSPSLVPRQPRSPTIRASYSSIRSNRSRLKASRVLSHCSQRMYEILPKLVVRLLNLLLTKCIPRRLSQKCTQEQSGTRSTRRTQRARSIEQRNSILRMRGMQRTRSKI